MSEKENKKPTVTEELLKRIEESRDIGEALKENKDKFIKVSLHSYLEALLKEKGISKKELIATADFHETYIHQVFNGWKKPSRTKLLQLCLGMQLGVEETQRVLKYGGYAQLYPRIKFDSIIIFALKNKKNVYGTNSLLEECGLEPLN